MLARFAEGVSPASDLALVCHFGAYNNFLSTILKNKLSTHLLRRENNKAAIMLWLPVDSLLVGGMTLFQVYPQAFFFFLCLRFSPFFFSLAISYAVPQRTECLEEANPFGEVDHNIKLRENMSKRSGQVPHCNFYFATLLVFLG